MRIILKLFISIFKFFKEKMGLVGILFIVLFITGPICFYLYKDNADDYAYKTQYELGAASVSQIEKTDDIVAHFSDYEVDETHHKKYIYQVTVDVTNVSVNPIFINREFGVFFVKNEDDDIEPFEVYDYYYEMDEYDRLDREIIAASKTRQVCFLFSFDEGDVPSKLTFFDEYDGEKIFEVSVPQPN